MGERAERLGQGDDLGGQLDARRGLGHQAVEAEPGGGFGEGAFVPGVLNNVHLGVPSDSGLGGCTAVSDTHQVAAANYSGIRAEFAGSRWPDLRTGISYTDLAIKLRRPQYTNGYETVL